MKFIIVLAALVAVAYAAQPSSDASAQVVSQSNDASPDGSYQSAFSSDNGINQQAAGKLKAGLNGETGQQGEAVAVTGEYSYTGPEGQLVRITYVADENGFQPQGDAIPKVASL